MDNLNPPPPAAPISAPPSSFPVPASLALERQWAMWCHLSALAGLIVPFGNFIGPLIIWQVKRNELPALDPHGKAAMNFQLSVLIYEIGLVLVGLVGFLCLAWIPVLLALLALHLAAIILPVLAGIKANEGTVFTYPLTLRLIN